MSWLEFVFEWMDAKPGARKGKAMGMGKKIRAKHYIVTRYWLDYYADFACTLCGNSGEIDTTGVKTAAGHSVGRKNFCICPNGQMMRAALWPPTHFCPIDAPEGEDDDES